MSNAFKGYLITIDREYRDEIFQALLDRPQTDREQKPPLGCFSLWLETDVAANAALVNQDGTIAAFWLVGQQAEEIRGGLDVLSVLFDADSNAIVDFIYEKYFGQQVPDVPFPSIESFVRVNSADGEVAERGSVSDVLNMMKTLAKEGVTIQ